MFAFHFTENAVPSFDSVVGTAPAVDPEEPLSGYGAPGRNELPMTGESRIAVVAQRESRRVPVWPLPVSEILVNETVPKFASGRGPHANLSHAFTPPAGHGSSGTLTHAFTQPDAHGAMTVPIVPAYYALAFIQRMV